MKPERLTCQSRIWTGPREGQVCGRTAVALVVPERGMPVCGHHRRAWLAAALARIAYYDPRTQSWF